MEKPPSLFFAELSFFFVSNQHAEVRLHQLHHFFDLLWFLSVIFDTCEGIIGSPTASQKPYVSSTFYLTDTIDFQYVFPLTDRSFLHQKYVVEGLSRREIATLTASSRATVTRYLHLHNIATACPERRSWQHPGQLPYGTRLHNGRVVPNKTELRVIRRMCDLRARGMTYRQIVARLEGARIPTKTGRLSWAATTVMKLVSKHGDRASDQNSL